MRERPREGRRAEEWENYEETGRGRCCDRGSEDERRAIRKKSGEKKRTNERTTTESR